MFEDDDVEIIDSTNTIQTQQEYKQKPDFICNLKIQHQKLLLSNQSLEQEVEQYKGLLEQTIQSLRQSQKDQHILKLQLSQTENVIQGHETNPNEMQKITNIQQQIKLKESNSNKNSLGNKQTNASSNFGYINSSLNSRHTYPYDILISQAQILSHSIKRVQTVLKQSENNQNSLEFQKLIQEFEENVNIFSAIQDQFMFEINRTIIDQIDQKQDLEEQSISSDNLNSQQGQNSLIFKEDLDISQFENEVQIKQQFEQFEISLIKLSEEEKQLWKEQLLQLINTL